MALSSPLSIGFPNLPAEVRHMVYVYYYGDPEITMTGLPDGEFEIADTPDSNIEYTNRLVRKEARQYRKSLPATLKLIEDETLEEEGDVWYCFKQILMDTGPLREYARLQITTLIWDMKDVYGCKTTPWSEILHRFPKLQYLKIIIGNGGKVVFHGDYNGYLEVCHRVLSTWRNTEIAIDAPVEPHDMGYTASGLMITYKVSPSTDDD